MKNSLEFISNKLEKLSEPTQELIARGIYITLLAFLLVYFQYWLTPSNKVFNLSQSLWDGFGGGFFIGQLTSGPVTRFVQSLTRRVFPSILLEPKLKQLKRIERQINETKKELPNDIQDSIRGLYNNFKMQIEWGFGQPEIFERAINTLLQLPRKKNKITIQSDLEQQLETLVVNYSPKFHDRLLSYIQELIVAINNNNKYKRVDPIYLLGPAGVGKTRFVKKLSAILGVPLYTVTLSGLDTDDIEGSYSLWDPKSKNGILIDAAIHAGKNNSGKSCIIFFDEIDKVMNFKGSSKHSDRIVEIETWLLKVLDVKNNKALCRKFNIELDISRFIFILAGNQPLSQSNSALLSRFEEYQFPPLSVEAKYNIAIIYFDKLCSHFDIIKEKKDDFMIKNINKNDYFPGARVLRRVVKKYALYKKRLQEFNDWQWQPSFDMQLAFKKAIAKSNKNINQTSKIPDQQEIDNLTFSWQDLISQQTSIHCDKDCTTVGHYRRYSLG